MSPDTEAGIIGPPARTLDLPLLVRFVMIFILYVSAESSANYSSFCGSAFVFAVWGAESVAHWILLPAQLFDNHLRLGEQGQILPQPCLALPKIGNKYPNM